MAAGRDSCRGEPAGVVGTAIVGLQFDAAVHEEVLATAAGKLFELVSAEFTGHRVAVGVLNRCLVPADALAKYASGPTILLHLLVDVVGTPRVDGADCAIAVMRRLDEFGRDLDGCRGGGALPVLHHLADNLRSACAAWL